MHTSKRNTSAPTKHVNMAQLCSTLVMQASVNVAPAFPSLLMIHRHPGQVCARHKILDGNAHLHNLAPVCCCRILPEVSAPLFLAPASEDLETELSV